MLAVTVAALAVRYADHAPSATPVGIAFVRSSGELVDWHGRVRSYLPDAETWSPRGRFAAHYFFEVQNGGSESWYVVGRADGSHRHILADPGSPPSWSADESTLAYVANDQLIVADGDGANAHPVPLAPVACDFGDCVLQLDLPVVSPDGAKVALLITQLPARSTGPPRNVAADLYVVPTAGGTPVRVGNAICPPDSDVQWSHDGIFLAYVSNPCDDSDGFELRIAGSALSVPIDGSYSWSQRADVLAYESARGVWKANENRRLRLFAGAQSPTWSPGGRYLAFARRGWVERLDTRTGSTRRLGRGFSPTWTTHGIAWSVPHCGPKQGIWLAGRRLTDVCTVEGTRGTPWRDEVWAADRKRERVTCGAGRDIAHVDRFDVVASDCEVVRR